MREKVMHLASDGQISWLQAADMMGISPRHMYRLREGWKQHGLSALMDQRDRVPRRARVKPETVQALCELGRRGYRDFSVKHFYEHAHIEARYGLSYSYVLRMLQDVGLADKAAYATDFLKSSGHATHVGDARLPQCALHPRTYSHRIHLQGIEGECA